MLNMKKTTEESYLNLKERAVKPFKNLYRGCSDEDKKRDLHLIVSVLISKYVISADLAYTIRDDSSDMNDALNKIRKSSISRQRMLKPSLTSEERKTMYLMNNETCSLIHVVFLEGYEEELYHHLENIEIDFSICDRVDKYMEEIQSIRERFEKEIESQDNEIKDTLNTFVRCTTNLFNDIRNAVIDDDDDDVYFVGPYVPSTLLDNVVKTHNNAKEKGIVTREDIIRREYEKQFGKVPTVEDGNKFGHFLEFVCNFPEELLDELVEQERNKSESKEDKTNVITNRSNSEKVNFWDFNDKKFDPINEELDETKPLVELFMVVQSSYGAPSVDRNALRVTSPNVFYNKKDAQEDLMMHTMVALMEGVTGNVEFEGKELINNDNAYLVLKSHNKVLDFLRSINWEFPNPKLFLNDAVTHSSVSYPDGTVATFNIYRVAIYPDDFREEPVIEHAK